MLVSLVLTLRDDSRGNMCGADGRICLIDVLPTGATRTIGVNTDILLINVEGVRDLWHYHH